MGLLRLLFYLLIGWLAFLFLRSLFKKTGGRRDDEHLRAGRTDNVRLEEDPVCGVYVSRETAIRRRVGDKEIFFCSEQCADKYLSNSRENST